MPQILAMSTILCQGARINADKNSTVPKCTIVGVPNAALAAPVPACARSATSVRTTNCNPIKAPAAEPTIS